MRDIRLTIGIPTLGNRADLLAKAIGSALAQSTPARVLVCNQDKTGAVERQVEPWLSNPLVRLVPSEATCLWENWLAAADACDTEFFAWLQDDDVVAPHMARRVIEAMDRTPSAVAWIARLGISQLPGQANWWQATGPLVPMDLIHGGTTEVSGDLLAVVAYFSSFALSPAVAFRRNQETLEAIKRCPPRGCDLFNERVVLAELGRLGGIVCDPVVAGYWVMHGENESRKQVTSGEGDGQFRTMARHIHGMLSSVPKWQDKLRAWSLMIGNENVTRFLAEGVRFEGLTETFDEARAILREVLPMTDRPATPEPQRNGKAEHATNRRARKAERAVRTR